MRHYHSLHESGELLRRVETLESRLKGCKVCPRHCDVRRDLDEVGFCQTGHLPVVAAVTPHLGEEPALSGTNGAGNIFFGSCNLRCSYCQNFEISQDKLARAKNEMTHEELARQIMGLQEQGCHSVNFVSPSHFVPQMLRAVYIAIGMGLELPIVYNTSSYDDLETLRLLDGIVDIYLPDLKYSDNSAGVEYSGCASYVEVSRAAVKEMYRQVENLVLDEKGIATRGVIVRHLVLPNDLAGSEETLRWIAQKLGTDVTISVMAQYYPTHKAMDNPLLSRTVRAREYERVLDLVDSLGFTNGWCQEFEAERTYRPNFQRTSPFDHSEIIPKKKAPSVWIGP